MALFPLLGDAHQVLLQHLQRARRVLPKLLVGSISTLLLEKELKVCAHRETIMAVPRHASSTAPFKSLLAEVLEAKPAASNS
jgi:hypothetical protein